MISRTAARVTAPTILILIVLFSVACSSSAGVERHILRQDDSSTTEANGSQLQVPEIEPTDTPYIEKSETAAGSEQTVEVELPTAVPEEPTPLPATEVPPTEISPMVTTEPLIVDGIIMGDDRPEQMRLATRGWETDWERHTINYAELLAGGPPRDGIPSIDNPSFISIDEASEMVGGIEPVIALEVNGEARAYPLQVLIWHEIVNDTIGGIPVIVTFCPLCNSALVFDRRIDGEILEFGTSGLLRNSDLVMYDRTTESLWQQFTGEGIVGELAGRQIEFLPSSIVSMNDFSGAFPDGVVLSSDTGFDRPYGVNPYTGYDTYEHSLSQDGEIALLKGEQDNRLPAAERVVTVSLADQGIDVAYPLSVLSEAGVINDKQGQQDIVVLFKSGTTSALGSQLIVSGEDVGATGVFDPNLDGQKLTFSGDSETIKDTETGSKWNILGQAIDGPLAGKSLTPIIHADHFWFSWAAFKPDTIIYHN